MSGMDEDDTPIDRSLLDAARPGLEPTRGQRKRLDRVVLGAIATGAVTTGTAAGAAASTAGVSGAGAAGLGLGAKIVIGSIAIASVIGVAVASRSPERTPRPTPEIEAPSAPAVALEPTHSQARAPIAAAPVPTPAPAPVSITAAPTPSHRPEASRVAIDRDEPSTMAEVAPVTAATAAPTEDPTLDEMRLLGGARAAIARHDGAAALSLLDEHARRFPESELREERSANRIAALCEMGEPARAHAEATAFLAAYPGSVYARGVRDADCGAR